MTGVEFALFWVSISLIGAGLVDKYKTDKGKMKWLIAKNGIARRYR